MMDEKSVVFTRQEIVNLIELLGRVQLTGKEVPAYVQVVSKINKALTEQDKGEGD